MSCCSGASSSRVFFSSALSAEAASPTRSDCAAGSVTKSRAASRNSFMRRSISSARSPTLCSRCSSAKVASIWRMAMTLAMLVIMITASTSRKLPKVSWPIESENDRIRWTMAANGMVIETGSDSPDIYAGIGLGGNQPAREQVQSAVMPASLTTLAHSATSDLMMSANCPSGALFGSHPAMSSFCSHVRRRKRRLQRLADAVDDRLRRARRHHDAEPRRHLGLGKALLRHGRRVGEIFRAAVADRADDPDGAGLHLRQRLVGRQEGRGDQAAGDIRHHLRIAAIADRGDVDAGEPLEQFEAEMPGRALAGMAVVQRARFRLGQRDVFGDVLHRQRWPAR